MISTTKSETFEGALFVTPELLRRIEDLAIAIRNSNSEAINRLFDEMKRQEINANNAKDPEDRFRETNESIERAVDARRNDKLSEVTAEWSIECKGGYTLRKMSIDEVLRFPNSKQRRITGISVTASRPFSTPTIELRLSIFESGGFARFRYVLEGPDQQVIYFGETVREIFSDAQPPYGFLYRASGLWIAVVVALLIILDAAVAGPVSQLIDPIIVEGITYPFSALFGIAAAFLYWIFVMCFFPSWIVQIGEGGRVANMYNAARNWILGLIVVGGLVAVAVSEFF